MTYYKGLERISQSNVTDCIYTTSTPCLGVIYKGLEGNFTSKAPGGICDGSGGRCRVRTQGAGRHRSIHLRCWQRRVGRWNPQSWVVTSLDRAQLSADDGVGSMAKSLDRRWGRARKFGTVGRWPPTWMEVSPSRRRSPSGRGWVVR
jgi:hypothetical protein